MIHSLSCKNFYSFKDLTTIDFTVNGKAPKNNGYALDSTKTRLSKVETVIGPNASGKTNLLKILPFFKWLVIDSFNNDPSAQIPIQPFMFGDEASQSSYLSVIFSMNRDVYIYEFTLNRERIISEKLLLKDKTNVRTTNKTVFYRTWNSKTNRYIFSGRSYNLPKGFENLLRSNASVISVAMRLNHKKSQEIAAYWQKIKTNVIEQGWIGDYLLPNANRQLFEVLDFFSDNETLKNKAEKLLAKFDLGLDSFDIKKEKKEGETSIDVKVSHSFNGKKGYLPILYESSGTKQLFVLSKTILEVLNEGGIAILDEIDVNLHPEIVMALFELFLQPETNPLNSQLLFSTHSHLVLSSVDKQQIVLTEKDHNGVSKSWRLDEMSGVRPDDNHYSKYITGAYGAFPNIK